VSCGLYRQGQRRGSPSPPHRPEPMSHFSSAALRVERQIPTSTVRMTGDLAKISRIRRFGSGSAPRGLPRLPGFAWPGWEEKTQTPLTRHATMDPCLAGGDSPATHRVRGSLPFGAGSLTWPLHVIRPERWIGEDAQRPQLASARAVRHIG